MGLIESMVEALSGGHGTTTPLLARAMQGLIGGEGSSGPGMNWLIEQLRQNGFGAQVESWLGHGSNLPIAPHDLHAAIGDEQVATMAAHAGLTPDELVAKLSEHLPGIVDKLSPDGHLHIESET